MKPATLLMLVVALGFGLGAMLLTQQLLNQQNTGSEDKVALIVATVEIQPGMVMNETMLKTVEYPTNLVPEGAQSDMSKVLGRSVRYHVGVNEFITDKKIAKEGDVGITTVIPEGKRAVTVKTTTDRAIAGFVKPGSLVDVVGIFKDKRTGTEAARLILQNVKVLAVNTDMAASSEAETKGKVVEMVTVLVDPHEAEGLALANVNAALQLILRGFADNEIVRTSGVTGDQLASGKLMKKEKEEDDTPEAILADDAKSGTKSSVDSFSALLDKLNQAAPPVEEKKEPEPTQVAQVEETPVQPEVQVDPAKKLKRVVYRDLAGNVLMEVLLDADSPIVGSLKGIAEDVVQLPASGETNNALRNMTLGTRNPSLPEMPNIPKPQIPKIGAPAVQ